MSVRRLWLLHSIPRPCHFASCCFFTFQSHLKICTIKICSSAIHSLFPPPFFMQPLVMGIFILRCLSNQNMQHSEHVDLTVSIHKHFKTCKHSSQTRLNFLSCCETKQAEFIVLDALLHVLWLAWCTLYSWKCSVICWGTCTVYMFFG